MVAAELRGGNNPGLNEALAWIGSRVDDIYGADVGRLEDVWIDPGTGAPRWLLVNEGRFGGRTTLIPFEDATAGAGHVWVPYESEIVRGAPEIEPGAPLTHQVEASLRAHYAGFSPGTAAQRSEPFDAGPAPSRGAGRRHDPSAGHRGSGSAAASTATTVASAAGPGLRRRRSVRSSPAPGTAGLGTHLGSAPASPRTSDRRRGARSRLGGLPAAAGARPAAAAALARSDRSPPGNRRLRRRALRRDRAQRRALDSRRAPQRPRDPSLGSEVVPVPTGPGLVRDGDRLADEPGRPRPRFPQPSLRAPGRMPRTERERVRRPRGRPSAPRPAPRSRR